MSCYKPLKGWLSKTLTDKGKRGIVFNPKNGYLDKRVEVPCGQCIGCRLEKSRQWAVRCMHESQLHDANCFLTLTYDDKHLPEYLSIEKKEVQNFIKRLRKKYPAKDIRYLYCGEYGEKNDRPHYHICLFGIDFRHDRKFHSITSLEHKLYTSETLDNLWSKCAEGEDRPSKIGHAIIGDLTFQSSAYVARYITKKVNGDLKAEKYGEICDPSTGEILLARTPEFAEASRKPALGKRWFEKHYKEVYPNDFVVINKTPQKPPKYYDTLLERIDPDLYTSVKYKRQHEMQKAQAKRPEEYEPDRLATKEQIRGRKKQRLTRSIE